MAIMNADIRSYADAVAYLAGGRDPDRRKLGHNTYVVRVDSSRGPCIGIQFHKTVIVSYYADGCIRLTTGGWDTVTTKDRLNGCSPYSIYSEGDGEWSVSGMGDSAQFRDGMRSDPDGRWQEYKATRYHFFKERRRARRQAEERTKQYIFAQAVRRARQSMLEGEEVTTD